jgi:hypothetical protein
VKPSNQDKQLGLASPLEIAASQNGKIKSPSNKETRLDASHTSMSPARGEEKTFFLTSSLIGRVKSCDALKAKEGRFRTVLH